MNLYDDEVDFKSLAEQDSDFASAIQANNGHVDFQNPTIVKQLTTSILKRDFGLRLELPDDRLCPPVPVRYSYVRWIQSLLASSGSSSTVIEKFLLPSTSTSSRSKSIVSGLDIGTGASCIYPLLYIASVNNNQKYRRSHDSIDEEKSTESVNEGNFHGATDFNIIATDTDPYSLKWARHNIALNSTLISSSGSNIYATSTKPSDPLLLPFVHSTRSQNEVLGLEPGNGMEEEPEIEAEPLDFTMCNPPFYSSVEELEQSYTDKSQSPAAVCTGSVSEMVYYEATSIQSHTDIRKSNPANKSNTEKDDHAIHGDSSNVLGGDAAFALRILAESSEPTMRHRVRWYSCMLGKLSSLKIVIERLRTIGVNNWAVCQLRAGKRTKRWAVAWSWGGARPSNQVTRDVMGNSLLLPPSNECTICIDSKSNNCFSPEEIFMALERKLKELNVLYWSCNAKSIRRHGLSKAMLNKNTDFDKVKNLDNNDGDGEKNLVMNGTGITQGNVWSRAARRRHSLLQRRCYSPNRGKRERQNEEEDLNKEHTQMYSNNDDASVYSRKRRKEDHDSRTDQEETISASTGATNDKSINDNGHNNTKDEQYTSKENETKSINMESLFAFRISIYTEDSSPSFPTPTITSSSSSSSSSLNTAIATTATAPSEPKTMKPKETLENNESNKKPTTATIRWLYGHDRIVFESFCGMMRRTLQSACNSH